MTVLLIVAVVALLVILYVARNDKDKKKVEAYTEAQSYTQPLTCSTYRTLNMTSGESPYKCGSCTTYGSLFNYIDQRHDQTYGVPNGCQKIF
jgi:predicted nucleic acid binding AN1-type Zn finger protein